MLPVIPSSAAFLSDRVRLHVVYCGMNVNRKELLAALKTATRVTPKRSARPSLQCVLLESAGPILYIKATDLETYFRTYIDGTGGPDRGFRVLVNAKDARDLVKTFRGETIEVLDIVDSFDARLGSGTLRGEDPDLLPELPTAEETDFAFAVAGPDFKRMVTEVAFAAAREDSRYSVNGILIERRDNTLRFVATDGRRLSVSQLHYMDGVELKAIVPAIPMGYIRMALGKRDLVDVHVDGVNVRFSWGNNLMVIRQLENRFPEYSAVIPKDLPVRAYIERELRRHPQGSPRPGVHRTRAADLGTGRTQAVQLRRRGRRAFRGGWQPAGPVSQRPREGRRNASLDRQRQRGGRHGPEPDVPATTWS
jgi:DNA polymerase-3 subunit beta